MELSDLSGYETRVIYVHLSEIILGLIFFFIFRHFGMVYRRLFLHTWSYSWIVFAIYMISSGIVTVFLLDERSMQRTVLSIVAQLCCFLQIIFILRGTYELIYDKAFSRKRFSLVLLMFIYYCIIIHRDIQSIGCLLSLPHQLRKPRNHYRDWLFGGWYCRMDQ